MHQRLKRLAEGVSLTGRFAVDVPAFLIHHGCPKTAAHSAAVAAEARRVALLAGADPDQAEAAGWLHDISAVVAPGERAAAARDLGLEVLPEEDAFPLIVHQKLSVVIAREIFGVTDPAVLSAVGCHTTLKAGSALPDRVLFVADKIAWDQQGRPPYLTELLTALDQSLDEAALCYLAWMRRQPLRVVHPWLRAAYEDLSHTDWRMQMFTVRPARQSDYEAIVAIANRISPEPVTADHLWTRDEQIRQMAGFHLHRIVAEDLAGRIAGYAYCIYSEENAHGGWHLWAAVDPDRRGEGAGTALCNAMEAYVTLRGARKLVSRTLGGDDASFAWAQRRGYALEHQRTESVLDLTTWDPAPFAGHVDRVRASGLELVTLHEVPESLWPALYEADKDSMRDHPEYDGEEQSWESFRQFMQDASRPRIWGLALDGEKVAGYSCLGLPVVAGGGGYTNYTGVARAYRGRGVALAVKLLTIDGALAAGLKHLRTNNNPENGPMLAVNTKLGYQLIPGPRGLVKLP
ncbi:MAG TPA: GNAT family N-acetyltransferase [Symbiobacteriaceae bacterium]|nr:GNAT family N-acetyltransferase [Symbiobacteriaceae bacterium]